MTQQNNSSNTNESLYFNIQADFGFTKHIGGLKATHELIKACRIKKDSYVLIISCSVGQTPC